MRVLTCYRTRSHMLCAPLDSGLYVYVCMCMNVCICVCVCARARARVCDAHGAADAIERVLTCFVRRWIQECMCMYVSVCMYVRMYVCMHP